MKPAPRFGADNEAVLTTLAGQSLDAIFRKAQSAVVGGEVVALVRKNANGQQYRFEEISTLEDLNAYKKNVYKYVKEE